MNANLSTLPTGVIVALAVLLLVQVTLDVIALVDLYRRPVARVMLGNKWIWVVIILLVNLLGAILYLLVGRKPAAVGDVPAAAPSMRTESIAESLYGPRDSATGPSADSADGPTDGGAR